MKAGQSVVLEIPFTGCPQPKATWRLNGEPVHDSRRIKVDTIYNMASLSIGRAEFDDAGEYSLVLDNIHGNVRLNIKVIVLGRTRRVYHFNFAATDDLQILMPSCEFLDTRLIHIIIIIIIIIIRFMCEEFIDSNYL